MREMRDLLRVIAEPALAARDARLRASLTEIVGKSKATAKAALLMDGSRSQAAICKESGINKGQLSTFTKALRAKGLIAPDDKEPKLLISIPPNFFEKAERHDG
jgi:hypothetical protein